VRPELRLEVFEAAEVVEAPAMNASRSEQHRQPRRILVGSQLRPFVQWHEAHGDVFRTILRDGAHHDVEQQLDGAVRCTVTAHELFDEPSVPCRHR